MAAPLTNNATKTPTATPTTPTHSGRSSLSGQVLKVMGIFSGVQVITILCSIIRTKFVAILLGPTGIGLFGIYNSVIDTISAISQVGTGTGVIRAIAVTPRKALPRIIAIVRRWSWGLGLLSTLVTLGLSPWLSRFTFGDEEHTWAFVVISFGILLLVLSNTEGAIFQGLKHYTKLAKATVAGAIVSVALSIPMFYFWGLESIIPSIMVYILMTWVCRGFYHEKVDRPDRPISAKETFISGKEFAILGIFMTVTTFAANAVSYIFMSYLNRVAGTETAGLYQAGFTLVNRYIGLVLTAVGMEFLPRISQVCNSPKRTGIFLSHEIILLMLVTLPIITLFITCDELIIHILYDKAFTAMLPFILWAIIGTVMRAVSWCLAFTILARNEGVTFLCTELASAVVAIVLNIVMYNWWGILGLGIAYVVWYLFYLVEVWAVAHWRYKIRLSRGAILLPLGVLTVCAAAAFCRLWLGWIGGVPFVLLSIAICFYGLKQLLGIGVGEIAKKFAKPAKKA
jgi:PST family polysaccharide transporter